MWYESVIKVLLFISVFSTLAEASCLEYGHSCWGAHGKRSSTNAIHKILQNPTENMDVDNNDISGDTLQGSEILTNAINSDGANKWKFRQKNNKLQDIHTSHNSPQNANILLPWKIFPLFMMENAAKLKVNNENTRNKYTDTLPNIQSPDTDYK